MGGVVVDPVDIGNELDTRRRLQLRKQIAFDLMACADKLMYAAKMAGTGFNDVRRVRLVGRSLQPLDPTSEAD